MISFNFYKKNRNTVVGLVSKEDNRWAVMSIKDNKKVDIICTSVEESSYMDILKNELGFGFNLNRPTTPLSNITKIEAATAFLLYKWNLEPDSLESPIP